MCRWSAVALLLAAACERTPYREVEVKDTSAVPASSTARPGPGQTLRFSVAAIESPRDTYAAYSLLIQKMGERLGMPVEFVQRRTYREVNDLLTLGQLDAALLCTGGYLDLRRKAPGTTEILAVPVVDGKQTYEALVVVPASSPARTVADLAGKRFAFTDDLSFSGHAYVRSVIRKLGQSPDRFFGRTIFTNSHDRSMAAVAQGLADGAAVHSGVWEHVVREDPAVASRLRVLHRSAPFGAMPIVASTSLPPEIRARLKAALIDLARDPDGAAALRGMGIDRFAEAPPGLFDSAEKVMEAAR